jgi:cytochrome P450
MLHDDNEYVEPEKFNPDRFLDKDGQLNPSVLDPARMAFGFGRRCVIFPFLLRLVVSRCTTT